MAGGQGYYKGQRIQGPIDHAVDLLLILRAMGRHWKGIRSFNEQINTQRIPTMSQACFVLQ